jgi:hypothetical protein
MQKEAWRDVRAFFFYVNARILHFHPGAPPKVTGIGFEAWLHFWGIVLCRLTVISSIKDAFLLEDKDELTH